ncbi:MAG TPA: PKD domain-containing protein, partial [Verrucomicrobiae bacterium]|nr:PKD domain-containing protein [Verrucomicrobiae bacterium]
MLWFGLAWVAGMVSQKIFRWFPMLALGLLEIQPAQLWASSLPYDNTSPVIYDNDDADDMYTDEYLLSLASAGSIPLKGLITTSGGWSQPLFPDPVFNFQWDLSGRSEIVGKALRSGMSGLPTPVAGSGVALVPPGSGVIEDTAPIDTPGAHLIVTEAHNATADQPLVVIMGGPPTTLASAYLMDNSITNTVVLSWLSGGPGENDVQNFNDTADLWATAIVDQRFRVVLFGPVFQQAALVDKSLLINLPNTELRQWMIDKNLPHVNLPDGQDHDGPPAISLMRPDYILTAKPKSVGGINGDGTLFLQDDPNGNILMVTAADQSIATAEWWRALSNSAAYGNNPLPPTLTPYTGSSVVLPGRVEAEQFDYGGPGVSYSNLTTKTEDEYINRYITTFRVTDSVDFDPVANTSGYAVAVAQPGEWLAYTVNVATGGLYALDVRLSSRGAGGTFHVELAGFDQTGPLTVPDTGGWQNWQTLTKSNVTLSAGQQVMRLVMDSGGISNLVGDIDYLDFNVVVAVSSNPPPLVAGFSAAPMNGTAPLLVSFTDSSSGLILGRLWDFGDGRTGTALDPLHIYDNPGTYDVSLTVFGPGGTNILSQPGLIVVTPPAPVASFTATPTEGVVPLTVNFTDTSAGIVTSRTWDFGDGASDTALSVAHMYSAAGVYSVSLTVFGPGGTNTLSQAGLIVVTTPPPAPVASFTAAPTEGVAPLTVNFADT